MTAGADPYDVVELTNKNILVMALDGANGYGKPGFCVCDADGNIVVSWRAMANYGGSDGGRNASAVALPDGGFAIAHLTTTGTWLAVYDAMGNQVVPPFQVGPANYHAIRIARLANNNIVVVNATTVTNSATFSYSVYRLDGTVVKAASLFANSSYGTYNDRSIGVAALTGGGFVIGWIQGTASAAAAAYWRLYDNDGVPASGSASALWPQTSTNLLGFCSVVALSSGGFAFAAHSATVGAHLGIFTSAGARHASINLGQAINFTYGNVVHIAAGPNGNVGAIVANDSGVVISLYSATGAVLSAPRAIEPYMAGQTCGSLSFNEGGSALACVTVPGSGNAPKVIALAPDFTITHTWQSALTQTNSYGRPKAIWVTNSKVDVPAYMMIAQDAATTGIRMVSNFTSRQQLTTLGVAMNNADKNSPVGLQMTGMAWLRRAFMLPWTTNQQTSTPPGQRMYALGTTAVMSGIQPVAPNSIN